MNFIEAQVIDTGEPIPGYQKSQGRDILSSRTITFRCPEIAREARPGQFVLVNCGQENVLPRPFSIHRVTGGENISLYYAVLEDGKGTEWLSRRKKGDSVHVTGPLGNGFTLDTASRSVLMVAGGMGIAPLVFLAEEAMKQGIQVTLLYGVYQYRYQVEKVLPGIQIVIAAEDGSEGHHGMITDLIPDYIGGADRIYICGPASMYRYLSRHRKELLGTKPVQVSLEVRMACGRGVCYGCTIKTKNGLKRVCEDGPVFDFDDIIWNEVRC